ncbi:MAG: GNAT family N-acetyltransferase [Xenococcaceae cyanobacterium MO_188.B32]|nr:GNAT family N-acetyltransferase [Xenococcaceae cyanobacterium MO_188.B32]
MKQSTIYRLHIGAIILLLLSSPLTLTIYLQLRAKLAQLASSSSMNHLSPPLSSLRQAHPDELIQLLRIQTDALRTLCLSDYSSRELEALIEHNLRHFSLGGYRGEFILVAEVDGVLVAWSALLGSRISAIYVHPQFIRQGIGSQLLRALETQAIHSQFRTLKVAASLTARPFYQCHGYQLIGRSFLLAKDLPIPYLKMKKQLLPPLY